MIVNHRMWSPSLYVEIWSGFSIWIQIYLICSCVFSIWLLIRKANQFYLWLTFREGNYILNRHQWRPATTSIPHLCNVCESVMYGLRSPVVKCDICGMYSHARCAMHRVTEKACPCKQAAMRPGKEFSTPRHHWVKGNIDPTDTCEICGLFCGNILSLSGMHCAWCRRRVHESCFLERQEQGHDMSACDLGGALGNLILPPTAITINPEYEHYLASKTSSRSSRLVSTPRQALRKVTNAARSAVGRLRRNVRPSSRALIEDSTGENECPDVARNGYGDMDPTNDHENDQDEEENEEEREREVPLPYRINPSKECTPLLVFVNSRSGGQEGVHIMRRFRSWLNPLQVYDLKHCNPNEVLRQFRDVPRVKVLVCGGDGSVGWVLGCMDESIKIDRQPPIAILPLGTGNDLARILGWGGGYTPQKMNGLLEELNRAHVGVLDRWRVDLNGTKHAVMNNYLGVGIDAQVALDFHNQRENTPGLFMSQFVNKMWYGRFGAQNFIVRKCTNLSDKIELECDGKSIQIPEECEGVIVLNINSFGGGSTLWTDEKDDGSSSGSDEDDETSFHYRNFGSQSLTPFGSSSHQDGYLDVVAIYGSLHLGKLQVGLSKGFRLCQCQSLKLTLKEELPLQIDGEPGMQSPCTLNINFFKQSFMLCRTLEEADVVTKKVNAVLDWAEATKVITTKQRDILLREIARKIKEKDATHVRPSGADLRIGRRRKSCSDFLSRQHSDGPTNEQLFKSETTHDTVRRRKTVSPRTLSSRGHLSVNTST